MKKAGDHQFADELVKKLVIVVSAFSRNLEELYAVRKAMTQRLVEPMKDRK